MTAAAAAVSSAFDDSNAVGEVGDDGEKEDDKEAARGDDGDEEDRVDDCDSNFPSQPKMARISDPSESFSPSVLRLVLLLLLLLFVVLQSPLNISRERRGN